MQSCLKSDDHLYIPYHHLYFMLNIGHFMDIHRHWALDEIVNQGHFETFFVALTSCLLPRPYPDLCLDNTDPPVTSRTGYVQGACTVRIFISVVLSAWK